MNFFDFISNCENGSRKIFQNAKYLFVANFTEKRIELAVFDCENYFLKTDNIFINKNDNFFQNKVKMFFCEVCKKYGFINKIFTFD